jgi:hypothetical protein
VLGSRACPGCGDATENFSGNDAKRCRLADRRVPHQQGAGLQTDPARPVDVLLAEQGKRSNAAPEAAAGTRGGETAIWLSTTARAPAAGGVEGEHQARLIASTGSKASASARNGARSAAATCAWFPTRRPGRTSAGAWTSSRTACPTDGSSGCSPSSTCSRASGWQPTPTARFRAGRSLPSSTRSQRLGLPGTDHRRQRHRVLFQGGGCLGVPPPSEARFHSPWPADGERIHRELQREVRDECLNAELFL